MPLIITDINASGSWSGNECITLPGTDRTADLRLECFAFRLTAPRSDNPATFHPPGTPCGRDAKDDQQHGLTTAAAANCKQGMGQPLF